MYCTTAKMSFSQCSVQSVLYVYCNVFGLRVMYCSCLLCNPHCGLHTCKAMEYKHTCTRVPLCCKGGGDFPATNRQEKSHKDSCPVCFLFFSFAVCRLPFAVCRSQFSVVARQGVHQRIPKHKSLSERPCPTPTSSSVAIDLSIVARWKIVFVPSF